MHHYLWSLVLLVVSCWFKSFVAIVFIWFHGNILDKRFFLCAKANWTKQKCQILQGLSSKYIKKTKRNNKTRLVIVSGLEIASSTVGWLWIKSNRTVYLEKKVDFNATSLPAVLHQCKSSMRQFPTNVSRAPSINFWQKDPICIRH